MKKPMKKKVGGMGTKSYARAGKMMGSKSYAKAGKMMGTKSYAKAGKIIKAKSGMSISKLRAEAKKFNMKLVKST